MNGAISKDLEMGGAVRWEEAGIRINTLTKHPIRSHENDNSTSIVLAFQNLGLVCYSS